MSVRLNFEDVQMPDTALTISTSTDNVTVTDSKLADARGTDEATVDKTDSGETCFAPIKSAHEKSVSSIHLTDFKSEEHASGMEQEYNSVSGFATAKTEFENMAELTTLEATFTDDLSIEGYGATKSSTSELENASLDEFKNNLCDTAATNSDSLKTESDASDKMRLKTDSLNTVEPKSEMSGDAHSSNNLHDVTKLNNKKFSMAEVEMDSSVGDKLQFDSEYVLTETSNQRDDCNKDSTCFSCVTNIAIEGLYCVGAQNSDLPGLKESSLVNGCTDNKANKTADSDSETGDDLSADERKNGKSVVDYEGTSSKEACDKEENGRQTSGSAQNILQATDSAKNTFQQMNDSARNIPKQINETESNSLGQTVEPFRSIPEIHYRETSQREVSADNDTAVTDDTVTVQSFCGNNTEINKSSTTCNKVGIVDTTNIPVNDYLCSCSSFDPVAHNMNFCNKVQNVCMTQDCAVPHLSASQKSDVEFGIADVATFDEVIKVSSGLLAPETPPVTRGYIADSSNFIELDSSVGIGRAVPTEDGAAVVGQQVYEKDTSFLDLPEKPLNFTGTGKNMDEKLNAEVSKSESLKWDSKIEGSLERISVSEAGFDAAVSDDSIQGADSCFDGKTTEADLSWNPHTVFREMQNPEDKPEMPESRSDENLSFSILANGSDPDGNSDSKRCSVVGAQFVGDSDDNAMKKPISDRNSISQSVFIPSFLTQSASETASHTESQSLFGIVPNSERQLTLGTVPDSESHLVLGTVPKSESHLVLGTVPKSESHLVLGTVPKSESHLVLGTVPKSEHQSGFDCLHSSEFQPWQEKAHEQVVLEESTSKDSSDEQAENNSKDEPVSEDHSFSKVDQNSKGDSFSAAAQCFESEALSKATSSTQCQYIAVESSASKQAQTQSTLSSDPDASSLPIWGEGEIAVNPKVPTISITQESELCSSTNRETELSLKSSEEYNDEYHVYSKLQNTVLQLTSEEDGLANKMGSVNQDDEDDLLPSHLDTLTEESNLKEQMASEKQNAVHVPTCHPLVAEADETTSLQVRADETGKPVLSQTRADEEGRILVKGDEKVEPDKAYEVKLSQLKLDEVVEMTVSHKRYGEADEMISEVKENLPSLGLEATDECFTKTEAVQNNLFLEGFTYRMLERRADSKDRWKKLESPEQEEKPILSHKDFRSEQEQEQKVQQVKELEQEEMLKQEKELQQEQDREIGLEDGILSKDKELGQSQELAEQQEMGAEQSQGESRLAESKKSECQEQITDEINSADIQQKQNLEQEDKPSRDCKTSNEEVGPEQILRIKPKFGKEFKKEFKNTKGQELADGKEQDLVKEFGQERELKEVCLLENKRESQVLCPEVCENEVLNVCRLVQGADISLSNAESSVLKESSGLNLSSVSRSPQKVWLQNVENSGDSMETFSDTKNSGAIEQTVLFQAHGISPGRNQSRRKSFPMSEVSVAVCLSSKKLTVNKDQIVDSGGDVITDDKDPKTKKKNLCKVSKERDLVTCVTDVLVKSPEHKTTAAVKCHSTAVEHNWPGNDGGHQSAEGEGQLQRDECRQPLALELVQVVDESHLSDPSVATKHGHLLKAAALASELDEGYSETREEPILRDCFGCVASGLDKNCTSVVASEVMESNAADGTKIDGTFQSSFEKKSLDASSVVNSTEQDGKSSSLSSKRADDKVSTLVVDVPPADLTGLVSLYDKEKGEKKNMKRIEAELQTVGTAVVHDVSDVLAHDTLDVVTLSCSAYSGSQVVPMDAEELMTNKTVASSCLVHDFDQRNTDDENDSDGEAVLEIDLAEGDSKNESERAIVSQGSEYDARKSEVMMCDAYKSNDEVISGEKMSELSSIVPQASDVDIGKGNSKKVKGRRGKSKRQKTLGKESDQKTGKSNCEEELTEEKDQNIDACLRLMVSKTDPAAGRISGVPLLGREDAAKFGETLSILHQNVGLEPATAVKKKKAKRKLAVNRASGKMQNGNTGEPLPGDGVGPQSFPMDFCQLTASIPTLQSQLPSVLKDTCFKNKMVSDSLTSVTTSVANTALDSNREPVSSMRPLWEKMCFKDNSAEDPSFSSIRQLEACVKAISTDLQKRVTNSAAYQVDTFPTYRPEIELGRRWLPSPDFKLLNGDPTLETLAAGVEKFSSAKRKAKVMKDRKNPQNAGWPKVEQIYDRAKTAEEICGGIEKFPWIAPKHRGKKKLVTANSMELATSNSIEQGLLKESDAFLMAKSKPRNRKSKKNLADEPLNLLPPNSGPPLVEVGLASAVHTDLSKKCLKVSLENCNIVLPPKANEKPLELADSVTSKGLCSGPNKKIRTKRPKKNSKVPCQSMENHLVNKIKNSGTSAWPSNTNAISDRNASVMMNQILVKPLDNQPLTENEVPVNIQDGIVPTKQGTAINYQELSKITAETDAIPAKLLKRKKMSKCAKECPNLTSIETGALVEEKPAEEVPAKKKGSKKRKESQAQLELVDQSSMTVRPLAKSKSPAKSRKKSRTAVDLSPGENHPIGKDTPIMLQEKIIPDQEILKCNGALTETMPKTALELPSSQLPARCLENNFNKVTAVTDNFMRFDARNASADVAGRSTAEENETFCLQTSGSTTQDLSSSCDNRDSEHFDEMSKVWSGDTATQKESKPGLDTSNDMKPFACPQCSYCAKKKGQLRKHLGVHRIYSCAHCDFAGGSHSELDDHMLARHPSRCGRKLCKKCHVLFRTDSLIAHERDCTGEKRGWDCQICGKKFKFVSAMRTHLKRWHSAESSARPDDHEEEHLDEQGSDDSRAAGEEPSTSPQPSQPSRQVQMNEEHAQPATKAISTTKAVAEPTSTNQSCDEPSSHTMPADGPCSTNQPCEMHSSPTQKCDKPNSTTKSCDQPFSTKSPCEKPSSTWEPSENPSSPLQPLEKHSQSCDQLPRLSQLGGTSSHSPKSCDQPSSTPESLPLESAEAAVELLKPAKLKKKKKSDVPTPAVEKPFLCSICEKHFKSKKTLKSHSQTKHGFKPDLSVCNISISSHSNAAEVLPTVSDLSKEAAAEQKECLDMSLPKSPVEDFPPVSLVCFFQECGRQFKKVEQLHRHEEKHAVEKPYKCDWTSCRKAFLYSENLQLHRQHHIEAKPFPCDHCSLAYWQKCSLKSHQVRVHGKVCNDVATAGTPPMETSDTRKSENCSQAEEKAPEDANESDSKSNEKSGSASICSKELNVYEFCESEEEAEVVMPWNLRATSSGRFKAILPPKDGAVIDSSPSSPVVDLCPLSKPSVKKPLKTYLKTKKIKSKEPAAAEFKIMDEVQELGGVVEKHEQTVMEEQDIKLKSVEVEKELEKNDEPLVVGKKVKKAQRKGKKRKIVEVTKSEEKDAVEAPIKKRKCITAAVGEKAKEKVMALPKPRKNKENKARKKGNKVYEKETALLKNSVIASASKATADVTALKNSAAASESKLKTELKGAFKNKSAAKKSSVLEEAPVLSSPGERKKPTKKTRVKKRKPKAKKDKKPVEIPVEVPPLGKGKKRKCAAAAADDDDEEVACIEPKRRRITKQAKAVKAKKRRGRKGKRKEKKGIIKFEPDSKLAKKRRKSPVEIVYEEPLSEKTEDTDYLTESVQNLSDSMKKQSEKVEEHEDIDLENKEMERKEDEEEELALKEQAIEEEAKMKQANEEESSEECQDYEETGEEITVEEHVVYKEQADCLNEDADKDSKSCSNEEMTQEDLPLTTNAEFNEEKQSDAENHSDIVESEEDNQEMENEDKKEDEDKNEDKEKTEDADEREDEVRKEDEANEEFEDNDEQDRGCTPASPVNEISGREIENLSSPSITCHGHTEDEENTTDFMEGAPSRYEEHRLASSDEATNVQFSQDVSMTSDYQPEGMSAKSETPTADDTEMHSSLAVPVIVTQAQPTHDDLPDSPSTHAVVVDSRDGGTEAEEVDYSTTVCGNGNYNVPCNSYTDIEAMYRRQPSSPNEHHSTDSQPGTGGSLFTNPYSSHYPLLSLRPSENHHPLQSLEGLASGGGPAGGSVSGSYFDMNCKTSVDPVCKSLSGYGGGSHASATPTYIVPPPSSYGVEQVSLERSQDYNYIASGRGLSTGSSGGGNVKFTNALQCQDGVSGTPRSIPLSAGLSSSNTISKDFFGQYFQDPGHLPIGQDHERSQGFVGQQSGLSGLQRTNSDFFRCNASALLPSAPYSSVPESLLSVKHPRLTQTPAAVTQPQHWPPTHEDRTNRPWDQVSPMIVQSSDNIQRNTYAGGANNRPDYGLDVSGSSSSTQSSTKRMDSSSFRGISPSVLAQPDLYGVPSAYSLTYSPTAAGAGYSRTLPTSQKHLEEAYRHAAAAHITDYRTLAAAQAHHAPPPLPDVYGAMGINPALSEFDRYYYTARDAMYRSQQLASAMPHPFMQQGSTASQMGVPYADRATYGREPVYGQPSPYGFMCDKQYLSSAPSGSGKMVQGGSAAGDYLHPPVDQQDPYRRSVIYMPRYF